MRSPLSAFPNAAPAVTRLCVLHVPTAHAVTLARLPFDARMCGAWECGKGFDVAYLTSRDVGTDGVFCRFELVRPGSDPVELAPHAFYVGMLGGPSPRLLFGEWIADDDAPGTLPDSDASPDFADRELGPRNGARSEWRPAGTAETAARHVFAHAIAAEANAARETGGVTAALRIVADRVRAAGLDGAIACAITTPDTSASADEVERLRGALADAEKNARDRGEEATLFRSELSKLSPTLANLPLATLRERWSTRDTETPAPTPASGSIEANTATRNVATFLSRIDRQPAADAVRALVTAARNAGAPRLATFLEFAAAIGAAYAASPLDAPANGSNDAR